jgi:hypothetical protein
MPRYTKLLPVIQESWYNCWAASMSWWLAAKSDRGRPQYTQQEIMEKFSCHWDKNGAMTFQGLFDMFREPRFKMKFRNGGNNDLYSLVHKLAEEPVLRVDAFPVIIGYNDPAAGGNHLAVLCEFDSDPSHQKLVTMDPRVGYKIRPYTYFESQTVVLAWGDEAGFFFDPKKDE